MIFALVVSSKLSRLKSARCSKSFLHTMDFLGDMDKVDLSKAMIASLFCSFGRKISGVGSSSAVAGVCVGCGVGWDDDAT